MRTFTKSISFKVLMLISLFFFIIGIIMIDSALAGEKSKGTATSVRTKWHPIKVDDEEGHIIAVYESKNVYFSDKSGGSPNGITGISKGLMDINVKTGKGTLQGYVELTYPNGDKLFTKTEGKLIGNGQAEGTGVYVRGTGNLEGIKGNAVWKSKSLAPGISFLEMEGEREIPGK